MQAHSTDVLLVYLVEDQAMLRESFRARLEMEPGIQIVGEAASAEQALQELETLDANVVLMDIQLPGMDGIEATRLLKEKRPQLPVVLLTSFEDEYVDKAIEVGASGYILKWSTVEQVIQALRSASVGQVPVDPSLTKKLFDEVRELRKSSSRSSLSDRQVEILKLVANGTRYKEIADRLFISETTVNREMRNIFNSLGVNDAAHAVSDAYRRGILPSIRIPS